MPKSQTRRRNFHQGEREYRKLRLAAHRTSVTASQLLTDLANQTSEAVTTLEHACHVIRDAMPAGQRQDAVLRRGESATTLIHEFVTTGLQDLADSRTPQASAAALRQLERLQTNSAPQTPDNAADAETALLNSLCQTAQLIDLMARLYAHYGEATDTAIARRTPYDKPSSVQRRTATIRQYQAARADLRPHLRQLRRVLGQTQAMLRLLPALSDAMTTADLTLHTIDRQLAAITAADGRPTPAPAD